MYVPGQLDLELLENSEAGGDVERHPRHRRGQFKRVESRTLGRHEITANCVAIALTDTPAVQRTLQGDQERLKRTMEKYIIRRPGQPTDIANMVLFLASDASPWITGQVYPVNGGFTFAL